MEALKRLLLALCFLGIAELADAAIARNSATSNTCQSASSCSTSHTVSGTNPFLAVCVVWWDYLSTPAINSVTWNGQTLTHRGTAATGAGNCFHECRVAIYTLTNPSPATSNATVSMAAAPVGILIGATSFTDVDTTTPTGTFVSATGNSGAPSVTASSSSTQVVLDCLNQFASGSLTAAAGQTTNFNTSDPNGFFWGASGYKTGSPSTVMSWATNTANGSQPWVMAAIPILPFTGGGSSPPPPPPPPVGGTQRLITWTDTSDNEQFFHLQWLTDQSSPNWVDISTTIAANSVQYTHNIGAATGDCYRIQATNSGGASGFTDAVCAEDAQPPPPIPTATGSPQAFDYEEDFVQ